MGKPDKIRKRHLNTVRVLRFLVRSFFLRKYRYTPVPVTGVQGPLLVLANHNLNLDPVLVALSFDEQMYFVASEHIFRLGFLSRLLVRYLDPISRLKGGTEAAAAMEILRRLRKGYSVCVFAEGDRSYNGLTFPIGAATGKLAKASGATMVTFKLEGGYFTTPRWAKSARKGKMLGYAVNVYTPERLKGMGVDEVNAAIAKDLFEDAYARQEIEPVRYKGKDLAEWLESALYICPACNAVSTLKSHRASFSCACGLSADYTEYGYLEGNTPYKTVTAWDAWQQEKLREIACQEGEAPVFTDESVRLVRVLKGHEVEEAASGGLSMYRDRIECGPVTLLLRDISDMAVYGRANVTFTHKDGHFELLAKPPFCGRKYFDLFKLLKEKA